MSGLPSAPEWSQRLTTVGVTGTNGKTSTTRWIARALARVASPVAQATTLGSFLDDEPLPAAKTWDGFLATMRAGLDRGGRFAAIELTSESLAKGFAQAWPCRVGVFTNLTHDHLDAHGSPEHYLASKAQLFVHLLEGGTAVLNGCDPASDLLTEVIRPDVRVLRYGTPERGDSTAPLDLRALTVTLSWEGTHVTLESSDAISGAPRELQLRSIGDVYVENALAALLGAVAAGVPAGVAAEAIASAPSPPGRFEVIARPGRARLVVDYAHTPDALARTLASARRLCAGKLWVVFGAGGNRDKNKRGPMGESASVADHVVLTSDNPRDEDPRVIAKAIREGIAQGVHVHQELDRKKAILWAVRRAEPTDVVVIAGKGHETDQIIGRKVARFSDVEVARAALAKG